MDYRLIVGAEQNMPLAPHMVPDMSGDDSWEELPISNRLLLLLRRSPGTRKPIALQVGSSRNSQANCSASKAVTDETGGRGAEK